MIGENYSILWWELFYSHGENYSILNALRKKFMTQYSTATDSDSFDIARCLHTLSVHESKLHKTSPQLWHVCFAGRNEWTRSVVAM